MTEARDFSSTPGVEASSTGVESDSHNTSKRIAFENVPSFQSGSTDQPPENFIMDNFAARPRAMSHHLQSTKIPSRKWLTVQARIWRYLMRLGMRFHAWTPPRPPKPSFTRKITTNTIPIELLFYVPSDYHTSAQTRPKHRYPIVVNFHGGGFTLGEGTDDQYYAASVLKYTKAIFISVNYRRAPEHPFPGPVDDGVEALMWLSSHATELRIDPGKTALSGFSAGGNLCFTVPFRLTYHTSVSRPRLFPGPGSYLATPDISRTTTKQTVSAQPKDGDEDNLNPRTTGEITFTLKEPTSNVDRDAHKESDTPPDKSSSSSSAEEADSTTHLAPPSTLLQPKPSRPYPVSRTTTQGSTLNPDRPTNLKILSIIAWYPLLDWTSSRSAKVRSSIRPDLTLKKTFTDLFDYSYLPPPDHAGDHVSPYASPALAPDEMIKNGLPERMQLFICEYDMLLAEGQKFAKRLEDLGKDLSWEMIPGVPHGWDKSPNPFRDQKMIDALYEKAGRNLQAVFDEAEEDPANVKGERIGLGGLK